MLISKASLIGFLSLVALNLTAQITLQPTVVTAAKYAQKQSQVTRSVDVLSDSLIQANWNLSLTQLLSQRAGIQIVGSGQTLGSIQTLFMRGAGAAYTLVLIDGIPVNDPSSIDSNFDLNFISLETIERIEILKGGESTLYGSNAVAGVVNIITKKRIKKSFSPRLRGSTGSFNTYNLSTGVAGALSKFYYDFDYSKSQSDGFSSAKSRDNVELEPDGFERSLLSGKVGIKLEKFNLGLTGRFGEYDAELDAGAFTDDADFTSYTKNLQLGGFVEYQSENNSIRMNYLNSNVRRIYLDDSTDVPATAFNKSSYATYGTQSHFLDIYNAFNINTSLCWLTGFEWLGQNMEQTYESVSAFGPFTDVPIDTDLAKMSNSSFYSSLQFAKEAYGLEVGFRANHHSVYNWNTSFTASGFVQLGANQRLLASVGNSFRNPSLYQLFSPYGNLDLMPEESINTEVSWEYLNSKGVKNIGLSLFNRMISDGIFFASLDSAPFGQYINQETQRAYGAEVSLEKSWGKIGLYGNYTFLHGYQYGTQTGVIDKSYSILRIPNHAIQASVTYQPVKKLSVNLQLETQSERQDRFFNAESFMSEDVALPSFVLVHFQAGYDITEHMGLNLNIRNLGNIDYTEIYGFRSEPVNWRIGLFYR